MHAIGRTMSCRTKFAPTVRPINPTVPKSLKGHCRAAFIRKFSIIWRKSLPGLNLAHPRPDGLSFTAALRACVPAAFASGGRSHCIRYLSGSFDILRQFAFEKLARRENVGIGISESRSLRTQTRVRAHRGTSVTTLVYRRREHVTRPTWCKIWSRGTRLSHKPRTRRVCAMFIHKYTNEGAYKSD